MSLRVKAVVSVTMVFILCITGVTALLYFQAQQYIVGALKENAEQTVKIHAQNLSTWMKTRLTEVEVIANTDLARSMDPEKVMPYLIREKKRSQGIYNSLGLGTVDGRLLLDNGVVIQIGSESSFPLILQGKSIISDPFPDKQNEKDLIISMETPVYDAENHVTGVLSGACLISTVFKENADFHIGKTDTVFIAHKDGTILYHPDQDLVMKKNLLRDGDPAYSAAIQKAMGENVPFQEVETGGSKRILFAYPVKDTNWYMFLDIPMNEYVEKTHTLLLWSGLAVLAAIFVLAGVVLWCSRYLFRKIEMVNCAADKLASGDLRQQLPESGDEIGKLNASFNHMVHNIKAIVTDVSQASALILESAKNYNQVSQQAAKLGENVESTVQNIADGATDMAGNMGRLSASVNDMEKRVRMLVDISEAIGRALLETQKKTQAGHVDVTAAAQQFEKVKENVEESGMAIGELVHHSESISQIVTTINAIAEQTSLLALNASIEAARAGENGRGFAVVAEEVRKLAESSTKSTAEVSAEIHSILEQTKKSEVSMQATKAAMGSGTEAVVAILKTFEGIYAQIDAVSGIGHEIAEVAEALSKENTAVSQAVSSTAALSEEAAAAAESTSLLVAEQDRSLQQLQMAADGLRKTADDLSENVNQFKV